MAVNVATLTARLEADIRDFDRDMRRADKRLDKLEGTTKKANKGLGNLKKAFGGIGIALTGAAFVAGVKNVTKLAVDAEEAGSAFRTVFGPSVQKASRFVEEFANQAGFAEFELQQLMATTGNIVQGIGATEAESAALSESMARLAGDVASFSNAAGGAPAVLKALQSGLTGETEALKTYGIVINQADIQQRALIETGKTHVDELTRLEKAQATLNIAYERSGKAVGDLERTSDGAANTMRRLQGMFKDVQVEIGQALVPALEDILPVIESIIPALSSLADGFWWAVHVGTVFAAVFSDTAKTASDVQVAIRDMNQTQAAGGDVLQVFTDRLVDSAKWSRLTTDAVNLLAKATRADGTETAKATAEALKQVQAFVKTKDSIEELFQKYGDMTQAEKVFAQQQTESMTQTAALTESLISQAQALEESGDLTLDQIENLFGVGVAFEVADMKARDLHRANMAAAASFEATADAAEDVDESVRGTAQAFSGVNTAIRDATDAMKGYFSALIASTSPTFRAVRGWQSYQDAIVEATEDGTVTAAEDLEILDSRLDAIAAFTELGGIEQAMADIATAAGEPLEKVTAIFEALGLLDGYQFTEGIVIPFSLDAAHAAAVGAGSSGGADIAPISAIRALEGLESRMGFATGGVVPGPVGAPQLAVVHGGETVTPPGDSMAGITVNNYITSDYTDPSAARQFVVDMAEELENYRNETLR